MTRIPLPWPRRGLDESEAYTKQPLLSSRTMKNVRNKNGKNGRNQGGPRGGLAKFLSQPLQSAPVKRMASTVYDAQNQTYTSLGNSLTIEASTAGPTRGDTKGTALDAQSNLYVLDGPAGVAKYNSALTQLWKIGLPCESNLHACRALTVDSATGFFYAGVSSGGKSETARLFCYRQKDDNKVELVWTIQPGGYVEQLKVYNSQLYALLNFPDQTRSYIRVYGLINSAVPEQQKEWEVPYPANDLDVSRKDGSVFVASDANTARGVDLRSPGSTLTSQDWTLSDLANLKQRLWSHFDATDRANLALQPIVTDAGDDGAEVVVWYDKSGHSRNWYRNNGISSIPAVPVNERGPRYRLLGLSGKPTVSFDGALYNGSATTSQAGRSLVGAAASSTDRAYRQEQLSPIPTYKGAQFALFIVAKLGIDETIRGLLSINNTGATSSTRQIAVNRRDDNTVPGNTPMPGSISLIEASGAASDAGQSSPAAGGPSGPNRIAPGPLSGTGLAVITWICDGGVHDQTGTATRSTLRINGHPVDRWQSAPYSTTAAVTLGIANLGSSGHSRFAGEIAEMVCLTDWYDQAGVQQRLITTPTYPDAAWGSNSDTEVERIEGYLAHKWGLSHEMATGQIAWLAFSGNPADGQQVTIDASTYTYRNAPTAANDIKIGASTALSASNLYQAVNRIGQPGVDYDAETVKHATFVALAAVETGAVPTLRVAVRSISPYAASIAMANPPFGAWDQANTAQIVAGAGGSFGWYPHPFTLAKTNRSRGGPPGVPTNTQGQVSEYLLLQSTGGILSKWQPNTGKLSWAATTGRGQTAGTSSGGSTLALPGFGGVGFAVKVSSLGEVYSVGPRVAATSARVSITPADLFDVRKIGDDGTQPITTVAGTGDPWTLPLTSDPFDASGFQYHYPRMDVDAFDNLYLPVSYTGAGAYNAVSLVGYRRASSAGSAVEFSRYASLPFTQEAYAVSADPKKPLFPNGDTVQHVEFAYLGVATSGSDTSKLSIFKLKAISTASASGSVRTIATIGVANGNVYLAPRGGVPGSITGGIGLIDSTAQYIDAAELFGKIYLTDGKRYYVFDPKANTLALFQSASAGLIPARAKLMASWNGRLVLARFADSAHNWAVSKQGDPTNWDLLPFTFTEQTAVEGAGSRIGLAPDVINAIFALKDDMLLVGGDHSLHRLIGDPATEGARFYPITEQLGTSFGRSITADPSGMVYAFGSRGSVLRLDPSGSSVEEMTRTRIPHRLASINLTTNRVELAWSHDEDGLRVTVVPFGNGGFHVEHYFWHRAEDFWTTDNYGRKGRTSVQPTCIFVSDGDDPDDRLLVFGCEDGYLRYHDETALTDDGEVIDSIADIGPLERFLGPESGQDFMFTDFEVVTDSTLSGPNVYLYAGLTAQAQDQPKWHGRVRAGRAPLIKKRIRGASATLRLALADPNARWALESLAMDVRPMSRTRVPA